jgi:hypothetical protein
MRRISTSVCAGFARVSRAIAFDDLAVSRAVDLAAIKEGAHPSAGIAFKQKRRAAQRDRQISKL